MSDIVSPLDTVAWDLDYTILYPKPGTPNVPRLDNNSDVRLNPLLEGFEDDILFVVTGRPQTEYDKTFDQLLRFGIEAELYMNPVEEYAQDHIASMKTEHLTEIGAVWYVEDNPKYRVVMRDYAPDIGFISVSSWVDSRTSGIYGGE